MRRFVPPPPPRPPTPPDVLDYRGPAAAPDPGLDRHAPRPPRVRTGTLSAAALVGAFFASSVLASAPNSVGLIPRALTLVTATVVGFAAVVHAHRSGGTLRRWPAWVALLITLAWWAFLVLAMVALFIAWSDR